MARYRLFLLDKSGNVDSARDLPAFTDDDAYQRAEMLSEGRDWELWQGEAVIARSVSKRQR